MLARHGGIVDLSSEWIHSRVVSCRVPEELDCIVDSTNE